jgi:group I intron endonuclease
VIKPYFIYLHTRPDKQEVFYVGRGKAYKRCSPTYRAYDKRRRSAQWNGIVNRNGGVYSVDIVAWCNTLDEVLLLEIEYIKKYGKKIDGTGTLINLTDGGDGSLGLKHNDDTKKKMQKAFYENESRIERLRSDDFKNHRKLKMKDLPPPMLGKKHSAETKKQYSETRYGAKNINAKKIINTKTKAVYGCIEEAAKAIGLSRGYLAAIMCGLRKNLTGLEYL